MVKAIWHRNGKILRSAAKVFVSENCCCGEVIDPGEPAFCGACLSNTAPGKVRVTLAGFTSYTNGSGDHDCCPNYNGTYILEFNSAPTFGTVTSCIYRYTSTDFACDCNGDDASLSPALVLDASFNYDSATNKSWGAVTLQTGNGSQWSIYWESSKSDNRVNCCTKEYASMPFLNGVNASCPGAAPFVTIGCGPVAAGTTATMEGLGCPP